MQKPNLLALAAALLFLTQCTENSDPSISEELAKVETSYIEGATKIEGVSKGPKIETAASEEYVKNVAKKVEAEIQSLMAERSKGRSLAVGDYDIGLPASATSPCYGERIQIFMDTEDNTPETAVYPIGVANAPWLINENKNIRMYFCRVDGLEYTWTNKTVYPYADSRRFAGQHAVLKLGPLNLPNITRLTRYFDNEDNNNKNSFVGNISPNIVNSNSTLIFYIIPALTIEQVPSPMLGHGIMPGYYVMATPDYSPYYNNTTYDYFIDDEDSRNANHYRINNGGTQSNSGFSMIYGQYNTSIKLARGN